MDWGSIMFHAALRPVTRLLLVMPLIFVTACGGATGSPATAIPAAPPTETVAPTVAPPTATPQQTTATPDPTLTVAPTAAPVALVLPAPLYLLDRGQIVRIERDGLTRTQITAEPPPIPDALPIVEFDVSATDGTLVYTLAGTWLPPTLVRATANGAEKTTLLEGVWYGWPRISPDGTLVAIGVTADPEETSPLDPGVYLVPLDGSTPRLIIEPTPVVDPATPGQDGRAFAPLAWSPDGAKLLLQAYSRSVEFCELAVIDVTGGEPIYFTAPTPDLVSACGVSAWAPDSSGVYVGMSRPGYLADRPGLWLADATTGDVTPIFPERSGGQFLLARAPFVATDDLLAMVAFADEIVEPGDNLGPAYTASAALPDGDYRTPLRTDAYRFGDALWARDGSGIALIESPEQGDPRLIWLKTDDSSPVELPASGYDIYSLRWGVN